MTIDRTYVESVILKGYKTIQDLHVELGPTLNIVIGKNGGGKTNFLTFLNNTLTNNTKALVDTYFDIKYNGTKAFRVIADRILESKNLSYSKGGQDIIDMIKSSSGSFKVGTSDNLTSFDTWDDAAKLVTEEFIPINTVFIQHGIKSFEKNKLIGSPLNFVVSTGKERNYSSELVEMFIDSDNTYYLKTLAISLLIYINNLNNIPTDCDGNHVYNKIKEFFEKPLIDINTAIDSYLPIKGVRLNPNFKVYSEGNEDSLKISNLNFEYNVNGIWLPYSSLSDGTKRMVSIFLDVICPSFYGMEIHHRNFGNKIVLLEEPELGIHPHMFHNLLNFIREYSQYMQVVITTHAPGSLNILNKDQLDQINICKNLPDSGTVLEKLSAEQKENATLYMDKMYLSDYWQYSSLEE